MAGNGSAWAPLRSGVFRAVWLASAVSNLGSWMHIVAAGWLMASLTTAAGLVALLQAANSIPGFLIGLPAGAMADVFDRRRLILLSQALQLVVAVGLGLVTLGGALTPPILLVLTLLLAAATALGMPAYAAITPEIVPAGELPAAVALNSTTMTLAQAVGPAIGGLLVALTGPGVVFLLNAASFVLVLVVIGRWRRPAVSSTLPHEHVGAAVRTGLRYAANAPELIAVLARSAAFMAAFSAAPALLAVVTRTGLGGDATDFGVLLGLVGVGGVAGALLLPGLRNRLSPDVLVVAATLAQVGTLSGLAHLRSIMALAPLMVVSGFAMMTVTSTLTIAAQQVLPAWVRGRGLAVFLLTFQLGMAAGALLWAGAATWWGVETALQVAAVLMAATLTLAPVFRLGAAAGLDTSSAYHPEPWPEISVQPSDGPVLATITYDVAPEHQPAFLAAARDLRRTRRRTGAVGWSLFEDLERPGRHVESFLVGSWTEHQRAGERTTARDREITDRVEALHHGSGPPEHRYLLASHPHDPRPAAQRTGRATHPPQSMERP